ncbi:phosphotransferase family protein [Aspergillus mulundensis]|uniref:Aminoglycoside phosphotransferase domain-containing protein n=1 Tax=Aspergillus mulundensis TaxID=1810919 RepID=A0A3D8SWW3_9EURO|nr:hypothetical protein DSM5745_02571 [Aspergillus mulundensis]RDW90796.1 hypothetical protein DSM5745_02571 [Aspergillus mulundensis]
MPDSISIPGPEDDEHLAVFRHVRAALRLDLLPDFASRLRQKSFSQDGEARSCKVISEPLFGSHNILFRIVFTDGVHWLLKIPANGYHGAFDDMSARALRSEALTMRLISRETTIPVPEVYDFDDSCNNDLNCPFILMNYVDGRPLYDAWFEQSVSLEVLEQHRRQALRDVAEALVQLNRFTFHQAGMVLFDADGHVSGDIGPFRKVDVGAMLDRSREVEDYDGSSVFHEVGPFSDPRSYFTHVLDRRELPSESDEFGLGMHRLLKLFIDLAVRECQPGEDEEQIKSVLVHPDLDIQNVIVSKTDGHLLSLIDWDGVIAVPQCMFGNESYPSWLTRDWDAMNYRYHDETVSDGEDTGVKDDDKEDHDSKDDDAISATPNDAAFEDRNSVLYENSPAELASYREKYQEIIAGLSDYPSARKLAHDSLVIHNLKIAADDPICTDHIIERIFEEVKAKTAKDDSTGKAAKLEDKKQGAEEEEEEKGNDDGDEEEDDTDDEDDDFYLYEVCTKLGKGELEPEQYQRLVDGFKALFLHEAHGGSDF